MKNELIKDWLLTQLSSGGAIEDVIQTLQNKMSKTDPNKIQNNIENMLYQGVTSKWLVFNVPKILSVDRVDFESVVDKAREVNKAVSQNILNKEREATEPFPYIKIKINGMSHDFSAFPGLVASQSVPQIFSFIIPMEMIDVKNHKFKGTLKTHCLSLISKCEKNATDSDKCFGKSVTDNFRKSWLKLPKKYELHLSVSENYLW